MEHHLTLTQGMCIVPTLTVIKNSCTSVTRQSSSIIKVRQCGVQLLRCLNEELAWLQINSFAFFVMKLYLNHYTTACIKTQVCDKAEH